MATLTAYQDNDYAKVFDKEFFYFNKQAIILTNVDEQGRTFEAHLPMKADRSGVMKRVSSIELTPIKITQGDIELTEFTLTKFDETLSTSFEKYCVDVLKPLIAQFDYKEQPLIISTVDANYYYDADQETLIKENNDQKEALGCGKIIVSVNYKKATTKSVERIEITVSLTADYQKDYEIIPFHKAVDDNQAAIEAFMARYISKPFEYLENVVGVELNFNKVFYKPETLRAVTDILSDIQFLDEQLHILENELSL